MWARGWPSGQVLGPSSAFHELCSHRLFSFNYWPPDESPVIQLFFFSIKSWFLEGMIRQDFILEKNNNCLITGDWFLILSDLFSGLTSSLGSILSLMESPKVRPVRSDRWWSGIAAVELPTIESFLLSGQDLMPALYVCGISHKHTLALDYLGREKASIGSCSCRSAHEKLSSSTSGRTAIESWADPFLYLKKE